MDWQFGHNIRLIAGNARLRLELGIECAVWSSDVGSNIGERPANGTKKANTVEKPANSVERRQNSGNIVPKIGAK